MDIEQAYWTEDAGWTPEPPGRLGRTAELVLFFGSTARLKERPLLDAIKTAYPNAHFMGCSTAGEICSTRVLDDSLVVTAIHFASTTIKGVRVTAADNRDSFRAGQSLAAALAPEGLVHVFVLSDGLKVNGSDLVAGLTHRLPAHVTVTGGLSGDGTQFNETLVVYDGFPEQNAIAALGLYGPQIKVGYGSLGGWDPFGPDRLITKSVGNVLYELDGKSALALYKQYLGDHAAGLPATGLFFPLSLSSKEGASGVVRTILSVDETDQSMTFAGDMPVGSYARLMKANFDRLIDGAIGAARICYETIGTSPPDLAILISCVGRKLVLKQRIEEEIEGVRDILGRRTTLSGFYSYGEISPFTPTTKCELHNQTMTITTLSER